MKKLLLSLSLSLLSFFPTKSWAYPAHLFTSQELSSLQRDLDTLAYRGNSLIFVGCYSQTEYLMYIRYYSWYVSIDEDNGFEVLGWNAMMIRVFPTYVWETFPSGYSSGHFVSTNPLIAANTASAISGTGLGVFSSDFNTCGGVGSSPCSSNSLDNPNDMLCEHNYDGGNLTIGGKRREY